MKCRAGDSPIGTRISLPTWSIGFAQCKAKTDTGISNNGPRISTHSRDISSRTMHKSDGSDPGLESMLSNQGWWRRSCGVLKTSIFSEDALSSFAFTLVLLIALWGLSLIERLKYCSALLRLFMVPHHSLMISGLYESERLGILSAVHQSRALRGARCRKVSNACTAC